MGSFLGGNRSSGYNSAGYSGGVAPGASSVGGSDLVRGRELGPIAALAPNSTIGKAMLNDPVSSFLFGKPKYVMPTAGPYAGVAPTLAGAQSGYALNNAGQPAAPGTGTSPQLNATFGAQQPLGNSFATPAPGPAMSGVPNAANPYVMASQKVIPGQGLYGSKASY